MPPKKKPNLDALYGSCRVPGTVAPCELKYSQRSCFELDDDTAAKLKSLSAAADSSFYMSHALYSDFTVLWLVDPRGKLWIALEEIVIENPTIVGSLETYPLPRSLDWRMFDMSRLGHPAIVKGQDARIGGELSYKPEASGGEWWLSNQSGRYGKGSDRTEDHLNQVAEIFRSRGINVVTFFYS